MANFFKQLQQGLFGKPERIEQISMLTPEQQKIAAQQQAAVMGRGAGGAFGEAADYYRSLLGGDSETQRMLEAPLMRQFQQDIMPGVAEQFAGMGAGGLSSSGFMQAATQAGTDLSERLGALRAGLRQQGAQGLAGLGESSLARQQETLFRPETYGLVGELASGVGQGLGTGAGMYGSSLLQKSLYPGG